MTGHISRADWGVALLLVAALLLVYNANGREIGSYDSQSTKFAARELLLRGTLSLNHVVGAAPAYAERPAFVLSRDGRYRSAFSPVPAILAAGIAYPFWRAGILDIRSPAAPALIAVMAASLLTALAVALLYIAARRRVSRGRALAIAIALGVGTGFWPLVSQTLWQHETAILGLAIAVAAFTMSPDGLDPRAAVGAALGLALAGAARPQLAPVVAVMLAGIWVRAPRRAALAATAVVVASAAALMFFYWRWFGAPLGAQSMVLASNNAIHGTRSWFDWRFGGLAGLLISPSRGLLIFSPVVAVALVGFRDAFRASWQSPLRWCALAAVAQFLLYGSYSVWWAGHTYGPRYMLDVLPLLVPPAAAAIALVRLRSVAGAVCTAALAWSMVIAETGAFCYPHDQWNSDPADIDRDHARLWSWSDPQFVRCWRSGPSPQNFQLFALSAERPR
jgi:hypothetical protein